MTEVAKTPLIYSKLSAVMRDVGAVGKDSLNEQQRYKFRGIDALLNAAHPALTKHGVLIVPEVVQSNVEFREVTRSNGKPGLDKHVQLRVKFTFIAEDGSWVAAVTEGEGLDSGDKATNKAMSAALKYALIQTLAIPTEDMEDADRTSPELEAPKPKTAEAPKVTAATVSPQTTAAASVGTVATPVTAPAASSASPTATAAPRRSSFKRQAPALAAVPQAAAPVVAPVAPKANGTATVDKNDDWG